MMWHRMDITHGSSVVMFSLLMLLTAAEKTCGTSLPNIIIILADDLGWNDVSFHGSDQFSTPNIDALAYSGLILHDYYTQPICTPARAALLTGRHPISNGMQHGVIFADEPWGLPVSERLLPEHLQALGYATHAVGKWHLGFYKAEYTPTRRGFHSFFGSWLGHQHHFKHTRRIKVHNSYSSAGYDMRRDMNVTWEGMNRYSADLYTEEAESLILRHDETTPIFLYLAHTAPHSPFQAPTATIAKMKHVTPRRRRKYSAMVTKVDESVGRVTRALRDKNMLNNSIILFLSDNGGSVQGSSHHYSSNWPLKGGKDTLWEGGVRAVGLIWSPLLIGTPRVHRGLFNIQDWLPTLLSASGHPRHNSQHVSKRLDGVDQWSALNGLAPPPYKTMLHNIDRKRRISALRDGKWKLVKGRTYHGKYDTWLGKVDTGGSYYTLDDVRESDAGRAILHTGASLPQPHVMLELRSKASISCGSAPNKDRTCEPHIAPCLFDIERDPCELTNLADSHPHVVRQMTAKLLSYHSVRHNNRHSDSRSYPYLWNNTWINWGDFV